jgi:DNA polymerase-3 subunit delta
LTRYSYAEFQKLKDLTAFAGRAGLIWGQEQLLVREAVRRVVAALVPAEDRDMSVDIVDAGEAGAARLLQLAQTPPFFGRYRVVEARSAERLSKADETALAGALDRVAPTTCLLLVAAGEPKAPFGVGLMRALEKRGMIVECAALRANDATAWVIAEVRRRGKQIDPAAAHWLVERQAGADLMRLESEVEKLALYVGDAPRIRKEDIQAITPRTKEETVWALTDAVARGDRATAVSVVRELVHRQGEAPMGLLALLASQVRLIWQTKVLLDHGWRPNRNDAPEEAVALLPEGTTPLSLPAWRRERLVAAARRLEWPALERALCSLHACDLAMKGIGPAAHDREMAIELLVIELCTGLHIPLWEAAGGAR